MNLLSSAKLFPMSKDGYLKEGILLFNASSLHKRNLLSLFACMFVYYVFFPLNHITRWFASSVQVIAWSREWGGNAFEPPFCCGKENASTCEHTEIQSTAQTFRNSWERNNGTLRNEIKLQAEPFFSCFFFSLWFYPQLNGENEPVWPSSILTIFFTEMSSEMEKWTRPGKETESEGECKCVISQGHYFKKARKQILCTSTPHSSF